MEQVFYIDLSNVTTKEELHELLSKELPLPDHYGHNLDALHDVLTDEAGNWNLIFYNTSQASSSLDTYLNMLRKMCTNACQENESLKIRFYN